MLLERLEEDGRGEVVREVPHQGQRPRPGERGEVQPGGVGGDHGEPLRVQLREHAQHVPVALHRHHAGAGVEQGPGEVPQPCAELDHRRARTEPRGLDDVREDARVVEEVLPPGVLRPESVLLQHPPGRVHRHRSCSSGHRAGVHHRQSVPALAATPGLGPGDRDHRPVVGAERRRRQVDADVPLARAFEGERAEARVGRHPAAEDDVGLSELRAPRPPACARASPPPPPGTRRRGRPGPDPPGRRGHARGCGPTSSGR